MIDVAGLFLFAWMVGMVLSAMLCAIALLIIAFSLRKLSVLYLTVFDHSRMQQGIGVEMVER